ncbi:YfiM family protein [Fulvivirgaceae bacterium PWU20]|uniref:YfiM family protein n=2 Tax=Chryseosolibacter indicus TaxID=2782351 RepID=A0ABS5VPZ3_9BACT|nr:YfiM family protein [Chryseosolibacter indicus]
MAGLYHLWYKDSEQQSFRFFNDNREWKQIDKIGHALSSFYLSYGASKALQWTQMPEKKCDLVGASLGFLLLVPIEIFDGFSEAYGASTGDLIADAGGSLLYLGQKKLWNEPRIFPKFSFHTTRYASIRPNTLGDSYLSQVLKDYNGQTYWLSFDIDKFIQFPKWLNLAAGYGAEGMVYARDLQNRLQGYRAYRQYYLSLDFDLKSIKSKSKVVNTLLFFANIIKLPAPAFSFSNNGTTFRALYF